MGLMLSEPEHFGKPTLTEDEYLQWLQENPTRLRDCHPRYGSRLNHAAFYGLGRVVRLVHAHGCDQPGRNGRNAMHYAAAAGHEEMVRLLHELNPLFIKLYKRKYHDLPIHVAAKHGHCRVIETLCELGSEIDPIMFYSFWGIRPVEHALLHEQWDAALTLLRCGSEAIDGRFFLKTHLHEHANSPIARRLRCVLTGIWPPFAPEARPTDEEILAARRKIFAFDAKL
jgi:hypothetical protein